MKFIRLLFNTIVRILNFLFPFKWKIQSFHLVKNIGGLKQSGIQINILLKSKKVGWAYLTGGRYYSAEHSPYGIIYSLAVGSIYRKLGIGKLLIDQCIQLCKEKKIKELIVIVNKSNHGAIQFYNKLGFINAEKGRYKEQYEQELSYFEEISRFPIGSYMAMIIST
ncbi:GNAT family N-acetyltransferase [Plebeiibacterium sediminum]|uniref:GNAT family N-acetyltransferase n=1 Tax=Plebeiibacterium sediminum TaxID=2992112 RepID=A0AAE3SE58_9BACT|nr:GNAT family N-acetyltransferase [Plebeiobacterium sediminum]MCW3785851.1 GNAT family N-acetyltransferase [Plebeiobacterium sediminum]